VLKLDVPWGLPRAWEVSSRGTLDSRTLLIGRLSEMPVPFFEGGSFVDGLREDERMSGLAPVTSRGDRELGAIAQCGLRFAFPLEGVPDPPEEEPALADVTQVVVLLSDTDAAARWFMTQTCRFEDLEGQEVGETLYRRVDVEITLTGLGEEAAVVVAHTESADTPFCETYINFRTGRLFGSVGASTYKELEVPPQLRKLWQTGSCPGWKASSPRTMADQVASPTVATRAARGGRARSAHGRVLHGGPRQPANPPNRALEPAPDAGLRPAEHPPMDPPTRSR
jgi:hypothetical protein